jgi:hypothetical protein
MGWRNAQYLNPLTRFPGFVWLIATGFSLPMQRGWSSQEWLAKIRARPTSCAIARTLSLGERKGLSPECPEDACSFVASLNCCGLADQSAMMKGKDEHADNEAKGRNLKFQSVRRFARGIALLRKETASGVMLRRLYHEDRKT